MIIKSNVKCLLPADTSKLLRMMNYDITNLSDIFTRSFHWNFPQSQTPKKRCAASVSIFCKITPEYNDIPVS